MHVRVPSTAQPGFAPPVVHDVLRAPGRPLEPPVRAAMEAQLGHDFSRVRVHTDARAAESARAVGALAYTVGREVVFAEGRFGSDGGEGRSLLAHELAHVVQQQGAAAPSGALQIAPATGAAEAEADRAAAGIAASPAAQPRSLQRKVVVSPPAAAGQVAGQLSFICSTGKVSAGAGGVITSSCLASSNASCDCACGVTSDPARTHTINVNSAALSTVPNKLWDGTTTPVPETSVFPHTTLGANPTIEMPDFSKPAVEFGSFDSAGTAVWADPWRILAHELCGHGRLGGGSGTTGSRPGHDVTIDTENQIAAEHAAPPRGHFADKPRQGESFFNPVGNRTKVVFTLVNGLHYEAP